MMSRKSILWLALSILSVFILLGTIIYGTPLFVFSFFGVARDFLSDKLHIHKHLITALSFPLGIGLFYVVRDLLSFKKKNQWRGLYVYSGFMFLFFLMLFVIQKDWAFDPKNGEPTICFTEVGGNLLKVPCSYKFHPDWGTPVVKGTPTLIERFEIQMGNSSSTFEREVPTINSRFFSSIDGSPLFWYYLREDGKIEFFNSSGRHPQFNEIKLKPINTQIVKNTLNYLNSGRNNMIVGQNRKIESLISDFNIDNNLNNVENYFEGLKKD